MTTMTNDQDASNLQTQLLTHLIDSASMKADIENLKQADREMTHRVLALLGELAADVKVVRGELTAVPRQIADCRADMRNEVERDFPSKTEAMAMEQRIEKQIADTDRTLGKQIAEVNTKLDKGMAEVTAQITKVDEKIARVWIKISVVLATLMAAGAFLQWVLFTSKAVQSMIGG